MRMYRLTVLPLSFAFFVALTVATINFVAWALLYGPVSAPDVPARVAGVSYAPYQRNDNPAKHRTPSPGDVARDLAQLATLTPSIRTYTSAQAPELPAIAAAHGLALTAGIWLTGKDAEDEIEIEAGTRAATQSSSVTRLIVGNETVLKKMFTPEQLAVRIKRVKSMVQVPVSTAEPWNVWLDNPRLTEQVDFITIYFGHVPILIAADLIEPIDESKVPGISDMFPEFLNVDAIRKDGKLFAVPFTWGTLSMVYDPAATAKPVSWKDALKDDVKGKVAMVDDMTGLIATWAPIATGTNGCCHV